MSTHSLRNLAILPVALLFSLEPQALHAQCEGLEWYQRTPPTAPTPRTNHAMAYDSARGVTVLFGGGEDSDDTWEWNGTWTLRNPTVRPAGRILHAMAYDSNRQVTVLFGGIHLVNGAVVTLDDTWEWNGTHWMPPLVAGPPARDDHVMAYDSARGVTVLFGGSHSITGSTEILTYGDTWEWNGLSWTQRATTGPGARDDAVMAYDSDLGVCVLFGGYHWGASSIVGDTWQWNGVSWETREGTAPHASREGAMVYDSNLHTCILKGGAVGGNGYDPRTYVWGNTGWEACALSGPTGYSFAAAYDVQRHRTVLFGGSPLVGEAFDDTWEYQVVPILYVDWSADAGGTGSQAAPFNTVQAAIAAGGIGTDISIRAGDYNESGTTTFTRRASVVATNGIVRIH